MSPQPIQNLNQLRIQMSTRTSETASLISTSKGRPLVNFRERQFEEDACFFRGIRYHQTEPVSYQESCHLHDFTSENLSLSSLKEVQTKRLQRQLKMFQVKERLQCKHHLHRDDRSVQATQRTENLSVINLRENRGVCLTWGGWRSMWWDCGETVCINE